VSRINLLLRKSRRPILLSYPTEIIWFILSTHPQYFQLAHGIQHPAAGLPVYACDPAAAHFEGKRFLHDINNQSGSRYGKKSTS
jgi:hypothetical protein